MTCMFTHPLWHKSVCIDGMFPRQALNFSPSHPPQARDWDKTVLIRFLDASEISCHQTDIWQLCWLSWSRCLAVKALGAAFHVVSKYWAGCLSGNCQSSSYHQQLLGRVGWHIMSSPKTFRDEWYILQVTLGLFLPFSRLSNHPLSVASAPVSHAACKCISQIGE